jgi:hypothetical protein
LKRIESLAFEVTVIIPSTIHFVAINAFSDHSGVSLPDCDFRPEFDQWLTFKMEHIPLIFDPFSGAIQVFLF